MRYFKDVIIKSFRYRFKAFLDFSGVIIHCKVTHTITLKWRADNHVIKKWIFYNRLLVILTSLWLSVLSGISGEHVNARFILIFRFPSLLSCLLIVISRAPIIARKIACMLFSLKFAGGKEEEKKLESKATRLNNIEMVGWFYCNFVHQVLT